MPSDSAKGSIEFDRSSHEQVSILKCSDMCKIKKLQREIVDRILVRGRAFALALLTLAAFVPAAVLAQPANDNLGNARIISGSSGTVSGTTAGATREPLEPIHAAFGDHSVWFRWTAPNSGVATFDTFGSFFDTLLAAYSGTDYLNLSPLAADDDTFFPFFSLQSRISFTANAGTDYFIAVD